MSPPASPADRYLRTVRSLALTAPRGEGEEWRARLRDHLERTWSRGHEELRRLEQAGPDARGREGVLAGLFVTAVGLFALGRLDVAPFLARAVAAPDLLRLTQVLRDLLPLPTVPGEPPWTRERIAVWVEAHKAELRWDEAGRRYLRISG